MLYAGRVNQFPIEIQEAFLGAYMNDTIGDYKITGVYKVTEENKMGTPNEPITPKVETKPEETVTILKSEYIDLVEKSEQLDALRKAQTN
jgi:hypothetical protein